MHLSYKYLCVQVERTSSEKAVSAAVEEGREKYKKMMADMKVSVCIAKRSLQ